MFEKWFSKRLLSLVWPVCVGVVPIGISFGLMAKKLGFSSFEVAGLCVVVYAGSTQFIAISMMSGGFSPVAIILTTFVVNLRHMLFSSTLAPYFQKESKLSIAFSGYGLTDESFAVNIREFEKGDWTPLDLQKVQIIFWVTWVSSCLGGSISGEWLKVDLATVGYGLTAMFIGLWSFYLNRLSFVIIGFISGFFTLGLSSVIGYKLYIVIGAVSAATLGCIWEMWSGRRGRDE